VSESLWKPDDDEQQAVLDRLERRLEVVTDPLERKRVLDEELGPYRASQPRMCRHLESLHNIGTTLDMLEATAEPLPVQQSDAMPPDFVAEGPAMPGGMGVVYRARQRSLGRVVALKRILREKLGVQAVREMFDREANMAARLLHPNIVTLYQVAAHGGETFIVMEFVEGESLKDGMARERPTARRSAEIVRDLARAVEHAHPRGVIHRDLKPANILLTPQGVPKVTDYGLAVAAAPGALHRNEGTIQGTLAYMAPEQANPDGEVGPKADVYSLGAILYEMLSGRPPFRAASMTEWLHMIRRATPVPPRSLAPGVPRDLEAVCLQCLHKDPDRRPEAWQLAADLDRFLTGHPVWARPAGQVRHVVYWAYRNPTASMMLAAAVVLGVALLFNERERSRTFEAKSVVEGERAAALEQAKREAEEKLRLEEKGNFDRFMMAARDAARAGDVPKAMIRYKEAIAYGTDRSAATSKQLLDLRVERLSMMFFSPANRKRLGSELVELAARPDLGEWEAQVLLLRGEAAMCDPAGQSEGRDLVARALALGGPFVSPAEKEYAEGLIAGGGRQSVEAFERAVRLDQVHFRAWGCLTTTLALTGRLDEARAQIELMRRAFPESPVPALAETFATVIECDPYWPKDRKRVQEVVTAFRDTLDEDPSGPGEGFGPWFDRLWKLLGRINQFRAEPEWNPYDPPRRPDAPPPEPIEKELAAVMAGPVGGAGVPVASLGTVFGAWREMIDAIAGAARGGEPVSRLEALARLRSLADRHPEGMASAQAAVRTNLLAAETVQASRTVFFVLRPLARAGGWPARAFQRVYDYSAAMEWCSLEEQIELFYRAAVNPTIIPRSDLRHVSHAAGLMLAVIKARTLPAMTRAERDRIRDSVRNIVPSGRSAPEARAKWMFLLVGAYTDPSQRDDNALKVAWRLDSADGRERFYQRQQFLGRLINGLINDWEEDEPKSASSAREMRKKLGEHSEWVESFTSDKGDPSDSDSPAGLVP
jgi:serine/threonine-protein kinase